MKSFATAILWFVNTIFQGFIIKLFWGWFILTKFSGLPNISVLEAIGFSVFIGAISVPAYISAEDLKQTSEEAEHRRLVRAFAYLFTCVFNLFAGYVVHLLM